MHRGQRLADQPFAAAYPGLLTLGIDDVKGYVYNGIVADCLRGAEFLLARDEVDSDRVALRGNDLALLTAARRGGFRSVHVEGSFLYRAMEARCHVDAYPLEELNDHLRASPGAEEAMARTLAMFDPIHHAPAVAASVAMGIGAVEWVDDRAWLGPLIEAVGGRVEEQPLTYRGAADHDRFDAWLAREMGVEAMSPFRTVAL
jgi:cephalosporin-C deacetylase-like acetyl esterase